MLTYGMNTLGAISMEFWALNVVDGHAMDSGAQNCVFGSLHQWQLEGKELQEDSDLARVH